MEKLQPTRKKEKNWWLRSEKFVRNGRYGQRYLSEEDSSEEDKKSLTKEEVLLRKGRKIDQQVLKVLKERYFDPYLSPPLRGEHKIDVSSSYYLPYCTMKHLKRLTFQDLKILKLRVFCDRRMNVRDLKFLQGLSPYRVKRLSIDCKGIWTHRDSDLRNLTIPNGLLIPQLSKIFSRARNEIELTSISFGPIDYATVFKYASHCRTVSFLNCDYDFFGLRIDDRTNYNISKIKYQDANRTEFHLADPKYNHLNPLLKAIAYSPMKDSLKKFVYKDMRLDDRDAMKKFKECGLEGIIVESQYDTICIESDGTDDYHFSFMA